MVPSTLWKLIGEPDPIASRRLFDFNQDKFVQVNCLISGLHFSHCHYNFLNVMGAIATDQLFENRCSRLHKALNSWMRHGNFPHHFQWPRTHQSNLFLVIKVDKLGDKYVQFLEVNTVLSLCSVFDNLENLAKSAFFEDLPLDQILNIISILADKIVLFNDALSSGFFKLSNQIVKDIIVDRMKASIIIGVLFAF